MEKSKNCIRQATEDKPTTYMHLVSTENVCNKENMTNQKTKVILFFADLLLYCGHCYPTTT